MADEIYDDEIYDFVESEKIRRLYYDMPNWYDHRCSTSRRHLHPGFISITTKERGYINALFDAINRHGVEPA